MTIGSLATVTLEAGSVVVVTGLVVVVTGFVVVVVDLGFVVVVVPPALVVVVTGFVVVVMGNTGGAVTVTLPGVLVMNGTGCPVDQPTWSTSIVLVVVRKATVAVRPFTRMLGRPLAAVAPVNAERSVATNGRHAP
jgi:hypothetical protein